MLSAGNAYLFYLDANSYRLNMISNLIYTNQPAPIYVTDTPAGNNEGIVDFRHNRNYASSFYLTGIDTWDFGDTGQFATGLKPSAPYNNTTATAANMVVLSNGIVQRSTSSRKYKKEIKDAPYGLSDLMKLRPVVYKGINDGDREYGGLIAEEVNESGLGVFVDYTPEGDPDSLMYANMVSLLIKAVQELKVELDEYKSTKFS